MDLGLIFFSTWSLLYLLKWLENDFEFHFLMISAVSCGLALGTKYNGLLTFFLLALFVPYLFAKHHRGLSLGEDSKVSGVKPEGKPDKKSPTLRVLLYWSTSAADYMPLSGNNHGTGVVWMKNRHSC